MILIAAMMALADPCTPQPMQSAIDSTGPLSVASEMIEFAATPSLDYPGGAWVVRLSRRGQLEATLEVVRLRRQLTCNRYDVEMRWRAPLRQDEYLEITAKVVPLGVPDITAFVPSSSVQPPDLVLDGTGIEFRLRGQGWRVVRTLNHYGRGGAEISSIFRELASKLVPASELPTVDWRTLPEAN